MLKPVSVREYVPMRDHTVFRIGGSARYFAQAATIAEVGRALLWAQEANLPIFILGAGSNVLVSDTGFPGLVLKPELYHCKVEGQCVRADAGVAMAQLVHTALRKGLCGMEWAIGIPGTVGGSVRGNAGCFGKEVKDMLASADVLDTETGRRFTLTNHECAFAYRHSVFKEQPSWLILGALFALEPGPAADGYAAVRAYSAERLRKQDVGQQCAGCMFKNIPWSRRDIVKDELLSRFTELRQFSQSAQIPAGFLVDTLGMKGFRIGRASVSEKHANYVVNLGGATAEHVVMLIGAVKERVHRSYGVLLEEEVQLVGFDAKN